MTDLAFFVGSFARGGTERHLSQILPALSERGWSIEALTLTESEGFSDVVRAAGIPITVLPKGYTTNIPKIKGAAALLQQSWGLRDYLKTTPPQILHCFLPTCCEIGALSSLAAGYAPVMMSRRSQNIRPSLFPGDKALERWALRRSQMVFGHSQSVVDELHQEGLDSSNIELNRNGIDLSAFDQSVGDRDQTRSAFGWGTDDLVFVKVANLIPYKGHLDLLNGFSKLVAKHPFAKLVLIGSGTDAYSSELHQLCQRLKIEQNVQFLGSRNDVSQILKACDAGVLTSHQEGFSNAILEYMAAGLPVVATSVGGNPDAVDNGETGLLVEAHAPDALANAFCSLADQPKLLHKLGRAGRLRVEKEFSLDACVSRYEDVYRRFLHQG